MLKNPKEYAVLFESVYKEYGERRVLENLNLAIHAGELVSFVGPSGCGKSTVLKLILGQELPTYGTICVLGQELYRPSPEIGIVYQKFPLFANLTVLENTMLGGRLSNPFWTATLKRKEIRKEALEYLRVVGLDEHTNKYPYELSGGMQQRVALAQAVYMKPKILLMDEPFSALDPMNREAMQVYLLKLWSELKMTVFFVTHSMHEAVYLGTRIIVLSQFYEDPQDGAEGIKNLKHGARIVGDHKLPRVALSTAVKESPEFNQLTELIRAECADADHLLTMQKFNLEHPDCFSEADKTDEEVKNGEE